MHLSDRAGLRLKLHDLHVLMTVVQAGSMSKAATLLNTTQPAVSRSIAVLERTIGVRLLERNSHGIEPTAYGRALLDGGVAAFDDLRQAVKSIEFLADPTAGEVRIGCTPLLAASFVSAVIDRLSRRYPRMVFHLVTGYVETLHRELSQRNVDLLIARRFGSIAEERLGFQFLFDDSSVVAAGAQSPWVRRRRIEFAELLKESWVLPPPGSEIASVSRASDASWHFRGLSFRRIGRSCRTCRTPDAASTPFRRLNSPARDGRAQVLFNDSIKSLC